MGVETSMSETSLKARNLLYVVPTLALDATVLSAVLSFGRVDTETLIAAVLAEIPATGAIAVVALLLTHIVPPAVKATLVYWRVRHALPGCRAYSDMIKKDPRIDGARLWQKLGTLPTDPTEQNAIWYKSYRKYRDETAMLEIQQRYLFFRDMASASVLILIGVLAGAAIDWLPSQHLVMTALLIVAQYIAFALAARERGERLVTTVLAAESAAD